jgi:hypothetical protein
MASSGFLLPDAEAFPANVLNQLCLFGERPIGRVRAGRLIVALAEKFCSTMALLFASVCSAVLCLIVYWLTRTDWFGPTVLQGVLVRCSYYNRQTLHEPFTYSLDRAGK